MTATLTAAPRRHSRTEAHGVARWLLPHAAERLALGVPAPLRITVGTTKGEVSSVYYVVRRPDGSYALANDANGEAYLVGPECESCDCKDALYRRGPGACKHCRALKLGLAAL